MTAERPAGREEEEEEALSSTKNRQEEFSNALMVFYLEIRPKATEAGRQGGRGIKLEQGVRGERIFLPKLISFDVGN